MLARYLHMQHAAGDLYLFGSKRQKEARMLALYLHMQPAAGDL